MPLPWLINPPETAEVPAAFSGGHVLSMAYSKTTQHMFTADRYFDENDNLLPGKLHRFSTNYDPAVGVPHAEIATASAQEQYVDVVAAGGFAAALRRVVTDITTRFFLDLIEPFSMVVTESIEVMECALTGLSDIPVVWLVGKNGLIKRIDLMSMAFDIEKSYPSNTTYGRAVVDPVLNVLVVPKTAAPAEVFDLDTCEHLGTAPFPWQGANLQAQVIIPPHGAVDGVAPPIVALTAYDPALRGLKLSYFDRDIAARNYTPRYYELPFCTGAIPPHGQETGYVGQALMFTTMDGRPPGSAAEVAAVPAKQVARIVVVARNGHAPSAQQSPQAYFVIRRVDIATGGMLTLASAGIPDCNPFKQHILTTGETATLWFAGHSLENAEQRAYPCRTVAM